MEGMDGIANGLVVASKAAGNHAGGLPVGAGEQHLGTPHGEARGRVQSRLQRYTLVHRERADK